MSTKSRLYALGLVIRAQLVYMRESLIKYDMCLAPSLVL